MDNTSSGSNWWDNLWNTLANALGWVNNAVGSNTCTSPNEVWDSTTGQCVPQLTCGSGTVQSGNTCVPIQTNNGLSLMNWILIGGLIVLVVIIVVILARKK